MRARTLLASLAAAAAGAALAAGAQITPFSGAVPGGTLPGAWTAQALPNIERRTEYRLVDDGGRTVLQAQARASAAGLIHPLRADAQATPWLAWRWRIEGVIETADMRSKAGDDYAARVYVLFDYPPERLPLLTRAAFAAARLIYGQDMPAAALCYVWDNRQPVGHSAWSPYTERLRMIVAESGNARAGQWVSEAHDVAADFARAFGEPAPPISAIVVASDTDNTGASARAWFGDLGLHPHAPEGGT